MMTIASKIIAILGKHGVRVKVHGDRLRFYPRESLSADVTPILRRHKGAILEFLTASASAQLDQPAESGGFADADNVDDETRDRIIRIDDELIPDCERVDPPSEPTSERGGWDIGPRVG